MTKTHNKQRVQEAKLEKGYIGVKSVGKYAQSFIKTASVVAKKATY